MFPFHVHGNVPDNDNGWRRDGAVVAGGEGGEKEESMAAGQDGSALIQSEIE